MISLIKFFIIMEIECKYKYYLDNFKKGVIIIGVFYK